LLEMINKFAALLLIGMASPYQILDWYGGRHTCHTASGALAQGTNTRGALQEELTVIKSITFCSRRDGYQVSENVRRVPKLMQTLITRSYE